MRLYGCTENATSFARSAGRLFTSGISRAKGGSRLRVRSWMLAIPLFALLAAVVPIEGVALLGYPVLWLGCLFGSWFLLRRG